MSGNTDPEEARSDAMVEKAEALAAQISLLISEKQPDVVLTALAIVVSTFIGTIARTIQRRHKTIRTFKALVDRLITFVPPR